jgi:DNA topoisomerase IA
MEDSLDDVAESRTEWKALLDSFYADFNASTSAFSSSSMLIASSPGVRLIVVLQRSLGGKVYPEQPKNTPVLAVLICFYAEKIGDIVTERLVESFHDLLDYGFTAKMEDSLDDVAESRTEC